METVGAPACADEKDDAPVTDGALGSIHQTLLLIVQALQEQKATLQEQRGWLLEQRETLNVHSQLLHIAIERGVAVKNEGPAGSHGYRPRGTTDSSHRPRGSIDAQAMRAPDERRKSFGGVPLTGPPTVGGPARQGGTALMDQ
eukprot:2677068-Prymnesium_polylepis.3